MKKYLIATAAVMIPMTAAKADFEITGRYGAWVTYAGTTSNNLTPMCVASLHGPERSFEIKYEENTLFITVGKKSWNFYDGKPITFTMQIDNTLWNLHGKGYVNQWGGAYIEYNLDQSETTPTGAKLPAAFLNLISNGSKITLGFPNGSEPNWQSSLNGSDAAVQQLKVCMKVLLEKVHPTQP